MPTQDQILVPETLLKKRKSQEKAREQRAADLDKKKKVGHTLATPMHFFGDDKYHLSQLDLRSMLLQLLYHLSGLTTLIVYLRC